MNSLYLTIVQIIIVMLLAPLSMGLVRMFKARMQGRKGASPLLPYMTILTLLRKEMVISKSTSWVFRVVPFMVLGTTVFLIAVLPLLGAGGILGPQSDFIVVAAVLALGAIFLVLGGLDTASAFGGMGSSREMTIASLLEPTVIVTFATFALVSKSVTIDGMLAVGGQSILTHPALILSVISLILIALAENARYPVDNPATHLELTMVHEAMILEYSGPYLAMLEYASALKLTMFALLIANVLFPVVLINAFGLVSVAALGAVVVLSVLKLIIAMFLLALLESSIAKMRFFRMQEYLSIAFFIALSAFALVIITIV